MTILVLILLFGGLVGIFRQRTRTLRRTVAEQKQALAALAGHESELLRAVATAEEAARAKSELLSHMSHEIRTPLTAILGCAALLRERGDLSSAPPERLDALDAIHRGGEHLLAILDDVLDFSKLEAGRMSVERMTCSPMQILAEVVSIMRLRATAKGLGLELEITGAIPQLIHSDPTRIRQILLNVVGNAVKFTQKGNVRIIASCVGGASAVPKMRFDVVDTGIGITPEQLDRLFEPFRQAETSTARHFGGCGLGLTISKRLAGLLGGDVAVASREGRGSTFTVTVETGPLRGVSMVRCPTEQGLPEQGLPEPCTVESLADSTVGSRRGDVGSEGAPAGRILVAEDAPDIRLLLNLVLTAAGYAVTLVDNGRLACEAVAAAAPRQPFDLVLLDMNMPVMDGYAAARRIRAAGWPCAVIALTAQAERGDREKCLAAGCDAYVSKPFDQASLLETIRRTIGSSSPGSPVPTASPERTTVLVDAAILDLVPGYVERKRKEVAEIHTLLAASDFIEIGRLGHNMKGSGGSYGLGKVSELGGEIERLAEERDAGTLQWVVSELESHLTSLKILPAASRE